MRQVPAKHGVAKCLHIVGGGRKFAVACDKAVIQRAARRPDEEQQDTDENWGQEQQRDRRVPAGAARMRRADVVEDEGLGEQSPDGRHGHGSRLLLIAVCCAATRNRSCAARTAAS
jgi:hypothetical protein